MTRYGFEPDTAAIRASWPTGRGPVAATVVNHSDLDEQRGPAVADGLEWLSEQLWRCYTHPPGPITDDDFGGERWQRAEERAAFEHLADAVRLTREGGRVPGRGSGLGSGGSVSWRGSGVPLRPGRCLARTGSAA
jgi:hypothetical protein